MPQKSISFLKNALHRSLVLLCTFPCSECKLHHPILGRETRWNYTDWPWHYVFRIWGLAGIDPERWTGGWWRSSSLHRANSRRNACFDGSWATDGRELVLRSRDTGDTAVIIAILGCILGWWRPILHQCNHKRCWWQDKGLYSMGTPNSRKRRGIWTSSSWRAHDAEKDKK